MLLIRFEPMSKVQLRALPPSQLGLCVKVFIYLILIHFRIHYMFKHYLLIAQNHVYLRIMLIKFTNFKAFSCMNILFML